MRTVPTRRAPRAAALAAAAALLPALCAGCGQAGPGDGREGAHRATRTADRDGERAGRTPPLTESQLQAALLRTGEVEGYRAQRNPRDVLPEDSTVRADRAACAPVTDTVDAAPDRPRTAYAGGLLRAVDAHADDAVQQVLLASYAPGDAAAWLDALRGALERCDRFTGTTGTGERARLRVAPGAGGDARAGDESVRFTLRDAAGRDEATVFTVVRTGDNTATFMSIGVTGDPEPVPRAVLLAQHRKLAAAAR
jgi:hypothetical protein